MRTPTLLRTIWLLGGLAMLLGLGREHVLGLIPPPRELPREDRATGMPWVNEGFIEPRDQILTPGRLPRNMKTASSWVGTDEWQGQAETAWFSASRRVIHVGIAGYPQSAGCKVWAEFRIADGRVARIDCPLIDPREEWDVWEIRRPAGAAAVRVVAEDRSSAYTNWVAISHPFRTWPGAVTAGYFFLQLLTTTALALTLFWGPGLYWFRGDAAPETRLVRLLAAGPLTLAMGGITVWCLSGWMRPQLVGLALGFALWVSVGLAARRRDWDRVMSGSLRRMLAVSALIAVVVVAKSNYSIGPQGELYRGTVSRNMEMTDRIDSRFSFYVVQAAVHHWGPGSPKTEKFFAPWTFFSRGPLAGLITIPVVMATNGHPPAELPENRWGPFDATGFAAYRITMIVLSSSIVVALFLMLVPLIGERWAVIGGGLLALTPFGVHEVMFTWPKWAATSCLLASFGLAHARRPLAAGVALAAGFLFHPLALLWSPWIGLWAAGRSERRLTGIATTLLRFGLGAGALVLPWMALGALMPHLPTTQLAGQAGFFRYWILADWRPATWETWWSTRWMNFANTFLPLHLYFHDASFNHPKLGSAYETSGPLVKFAEVWWNSLPFGMGLGLWALSLGALAKAMRSLTAVVMLFVIAPALLITAYWGMDPLGLMRECGHPLFVALIAVTCVIAARTAGKIRAILLHPSVPWLQLPETWLMLWLTTFSNAQPWAVEFGHLDPLYFGVSTLALGATAYVARAKTGEPLVNLNFTNGAPLINTNGH
ncbi:MAG: hypothetical protein ACREH8_05755 [Opitutaceae bacterium]